LWGSGDADADVLNLLYPNADRGTNGYCYGSSHSYTYSSVDSDSNCYTYSNVDNDGNGHTDADVLNLLYPHADRETNGYCHGSSHSYTYSNVNSDGNCDWDCSAEVYADAQATPHARPAPVAQSCWI
jgi:hypothetical protein